MILTEISGHTLTITLNDPARRNPITPEISDEILAAVQEAVDTGTIGALILTGAGGTFCSGGDLQKMPPASAEHARQRMSRYAALIRTLHAAPFPVMCAVEGAVAGIGVGIAAACDVVVASEDSTIYLPFSRLGLFPDGGLIYSLARRVGPARAKSLLLKGDPVRATRAHDLGLIDALVKPGTSLQEAHRTADTLMQRSALSIQHIKQAFLGDEQSLEHTLHRESESQSQLYFTEDFAARRDAFLQR